MNSTAISVTIQKPADSPYWLVSIADAVTSSNGESVSFTVAIQRDPALTLHEVQWRAVDRAKTLLQDYLDREGPRS